MSLTRQTQKVFCSNGNANEIAAFGSMKTGTPVYSTSLSTLQSQEYTEGWAEAIESDKAPYLEEMNGVQYGFSYQIAYILQEGIPEYDANTEYTNKSVVKTVNNGILTIYVSKANNNIGNALSDTAYWKPMELDLSGKADLSYVNGLFKTYETTWSDYAANTKYTFDLSSEDIADIDVTQWSVEVWAKIKTTAVGGFSADSVFLLSSQNQYGGADQYELGVGIIVENKVLTMWTGNTVSIRSGNAAAYSNVQLKIVIKAMEEIS